MPRKIFGTGLSRTGTKSLSSAFALLGYRCAHYPGFRFIDGKIEIDAEALDRHDALFDTPVALAFEDLDRRYPGSKFVHTVRELDAWLDSCRRFFFDGAFTRPRVIELCRQIYGTHVFDETSFRRAYARHDARVRDYFANREQDLLVIDVCGGEGWETLGPFFDVRVSHQRFPRR